MSMHVKVDDWGEPIKLGPHEWEYESAVLGSVRVRVSHWRGQLVGVEVWRSVPDSDLYWHDAMIDPERPWLHGGTPDKPERMPEDDPRGGKLL